MKDAKLEVLERLYGLAQIIRRRGTPEQALAVVPYEQQFNRDLAEHKRQLELELSQSKQPQEQAA